MPVEADANRVIPPEERRRNVLAIAFFILLAGLVLYAAGLILASFVTPIVLGGVIVVLTFPPYRRLRARLGGRAHLASAVMLLAVNVMIILPAVILLMLLIDQATTLLKLLQATDVPAFVRSFRFPERLQQVLPAVQIPQIDIAGEILALVRRLPAIVATQGGKVLAGLANVIIGYFFMLFAIYYFYTEGETLMGEIRYLSPLPDRYDDELIAKFKDVIDATFRGHVLTALAQGLVTGIGLAIAGVPGAIFWGAVATVLALLPIVGAAFVWIPAVGYLFVTAGGEGRGVGSAIFLLIWGVVVISLVDNVIRPWAMKGKTEMSAVLLLFSIFGGVSAFGALGLILGPLVFALLVSVIHIYKSLFSATLDEQNTDAQPL